jgi:hypothetical protein
MRAAVLAVGLAAILGAAPAFAEDGPGDIDSLVLLTRRGAAASFDREGRCALRVGGEWVEFSRGRDASIRQALDPGVNVVLWEPTNERLARRVSVVVTLATGGPGGGPLLMTLGDLGGRTGVPLFVVDFVSRACKASSPTDWLALSRVGELPAAARRELVQIVSIAAFRGYQLDSSPSSSDAPFTGIPHWAARCRAGRDCDLWAASVVRGFLPPRPPG